MALDVGAGVPAAVLALRERRREYEQEPRLGDTLTDGDGIDATGHAPSVLRSAGERNALRDHVECRDALFLGRLGKLNVRSTNVSTCRRPNSASSVRCSAGNVYESKFDSQMPRAVRQRESISDCCGPTD